jgi:hypothetical protein
MSQSPPSNKILGRREIEDYLRELTDAWIHLEDEISTMMNQLDRAEPFLRVWDIEAREAEIAGKEALANEVYEAVKNVERILGNIEAYENLDQAA